MGLLLYVHTRVSVNPGTPFVFPRNAVVPTRLSSFVFALLFHSIRAIRSEQLRDFRKFQARPRMERWGQL